MRPRNVQAYCGEDHVTIKNTAIDHVARSCCLIMLLDHVTNQDKRSCPLNDQFHILICRFNRQVHASLSLIMFRAPGLRRFASCCVPCHVPWPCPCHVPGTCSDPGTCSTSQILSQIDPGTCSTSQILPQSDPGTCSTSQILPRSDPGTCSTS